MDKLPAKTIERLNSYRRLLLRYEYMERPYVFSADLARSLNINPVHVRRDLMLLGFQGNNARGYNVKELNKAIALHFQKIAQTKACIIGFGNMGKAVFEQITESESPITIAAIFDSSPENIHKTFAYVSCYSIDKLTQVIPSSAITLAIITAFEEDITALLPLLTASGIAGIMNLTAVQPTLPKGMLMESFDITSAIISLAYKTNC